MDMVIDSEVLKQAEAFVKQAQDALRGVAQATDAFAKAAEVTVSTLVKQGLLGADRQAERVKLYKDNPLTVLADLQKTAGLVPLQKLGGPSSDEPADHAPVAGADETADAAYERILLQGAQR